MKRKLSAITLALLGSTAAYAGMSVESELGSFSIGGDVEFDIDYRDSGEEGGPDHEFSQGGRILLGFYGDRVTESNYQFKVAAQPLMGSNGTVNVDDAYFAFGEVDGWDLRIGRFEAYDMFPVGQDTFLEYSGNTSNELIVQGAPYIYQMKEARGRGTGGQLMYSQSFDNIYVEVAALLGDRTNLFDVTDDALDKQSDGDALTVRPVVATTFGDFTVAAAVETNLVTDAVTLDDEDLLERTGYGITTNYSNDMVSANFNVAYMDGVDEQNLTLGANVLFARIGLGYVYADNDYDDGHYFGYDEGASASTTYASYEFADVLDVDDFSIFLGTYYTTVDDDTTNSDFAGTDEDFGLRTRFKFYF